MRASTLVSVTAAAMAVTALCSGCTGDQIVNTGEPRPTTTAPPAWTPPLAPPDPAHLVDSSAYVAYPQGLAAYFFTTPSGRWTCAILPRVKAGCQPTGGGPVGIAGAPPSVPDAAGLPASPNAIAVQRDEDAQFVALDRPEFRLDPGPANVLGFNRILVVAGFRCNVQEQSGVSCASERTGKGFTFAAEGVIPQYTDVPPGAPAR